MWRAISALQSNTGKMWQQALKTRASEQHAINNWQGDMAWHVSQQPRWGAVLWAGRCGLANVGWLATCEDGAWPAEPCKWQALHLGLAAG
jgi:hypothetical protein